MLLASLVLQSVAEEKGGTVQLVARLSCKTESDKKGGGFLHALPASVELYNEPHSSLVL